jgi:hypothetical protein
MVSFNESRRKDPEKLCLDCLRGNLSGLIYEVQFMVQPSGLNRQDLENYFAYALIAAIPYDKRTNVTVLRGEKPDPLLALAGTQVNLMIECSLILLKNPEPNNALLYVCFDLDAQSALEGGFRRPNDPRIGPLLGRCL